MFYAVTAPGFSQRVHDGIADGIVAALEQAVARLAPGRARLASAPLPLAAGIAANRSVDAYNRNADVVPLSADRADEAMNRRMVVLRVERADGRPIGLVSWFPLHGTCIHADNTRLHPDHKGMAAAWCEARASERGEPDFVALFAQEAPGDVTPNLVWDRRRKHMAGGYTDDFAHAAHVGAVQAAHAWELLSAAASTAPLEGPLGGALRYVDLSVQAAAPRFTGGRADLGGAPARVGFAFAEGTDEGPGPLYTMPWVNRILCAAVARRRARPDTPAWLGRHAGKYPWWDLGQGSAGKALGLLPSMNIVMQVVSEPRVAWYRETVLSGRLGALPWIPQVLPAQVLRIGTLTLAGIPQEPTTVAARRLAHAIRRGPAETVVINGYANAYAGYLVTPEEYDHQHYEAACTMFGRWSLPAWCTAFSDVRDVLDAGAAEASIGTPPHRFTATDTLGPAALGAEA
jgi:neutral ceramidase